jgi:hypothetical protein
MFRENEIMSKPHVQRISEEIGGKKADDVTERRLEMVCADRELYEAVLSVGKAAPAAASERPFYDGAVSSSVRRQRSKSACTMCSAHHRHWRGTLKQQKSEKPHACIFTYMYPPRKFK